MEMFSGKEFHTVGAATQETSKFNLYDSIVIK